MGKHNLFISWAGERSKAVAEALRSWLPMVIQRANPFMSEADVDKGTRGLDEIARELEGLRAGIICLTPENLNNAWILYEAGALSKTVDSKTRLWTYLLGGLEVQDVRPPLGIFQHTNADKKEETKKLIHSINLSIGNDPVPDSNLGTIFDKMWPDLEKVIKNLPTPSEVVEAKRPSDEILAEILELTRAAANSRKQTEWLDQYTPLLMQFFPLLEQVIKSIPMGSQSGPQPQP